jgi:DNA helicase-2/ATP-dependent DNA helicase PcrA
VTGLEEGLFPLMSGGQDADIEEERRLFYVGVTRAEEQVFLSAARSRFRFGEQQSCIKSRFLEECEPGLIATEAGGEFTGGRRRERIAVERRPHYSDMDPHYYRESLLQRPSPAQSGGERRIVYDEGEGGGLVPGALVEHDLFGEGKVLAMEGTGQQAKATVFFEEVGQKKLVLRFARLKVVG